MCRQWTNWQTFVRKFFHVGQIVSTLLVSCHMTYMISSVLGDIHQYKSVDGHIWMYISEGTENCFPC